MRLRGYLKEPAHSCVLGGLVGFAMGFCERPGRGISWNPVLSGGSPRMTVPVSFLLPFVDGRRYSLQEEIPAPRDTAPF